MKSSPLALALALLSTLALADAPPEAPGTVWITLRPQASLALQNPSVQAGGKQAQPGPVSGTFRVEGLPSGWLPIAASAEGYQPVERKVLLPTGGQASVFLPLERIPGPGTLQGRVLREEGRTGARLPVAGVEVWIGAVMAATSNEEGLFTVPEAGPGPVALKLSGAGVRPQEEVVVVPPHGEASVEFLMQQGEPLRAWMRGQVRSTQGRPVQATLLIAETKLKARTRPKGDFELRLPAGRYHVTFAAKGYRSQIKVVDVGAGDQALFYVDLSPQEN